MTIDQAKLSLRISSEDATHDSDLIDAIDAATEQLEQDIDRAIITQTFVYQANAFPVGAFDIPKAPIQSVSALTYIDSEGDTQTVDPATYAIDRGRRMVYLTAGNEWPTAIAQVNAVELEFVAGYGDGPSNVPRLLQRAITLQVGKWFYDPDMMTTSNDRAYRDIVNKLVATDHQAA